MQMIAGELIRLEVVDYITDSTVCEVIAKLLAHIKECNPSIQIIAVGDMSQKIYD